MANSIHLPAPLQVGTTLGLVRTVQAGPHHYPLRLPPSKGRKTALDMSTRVFSIVRCTRLDSVCIQCQYSVFLRQLEWDVAVITPPLCPYLDFSRGTRPRHDEGLHRGPVTAAMEWKALLRIGPPANGVAKGPSVQERTLCILFSVPSTSHSIKVQAALTRRAHRSRKSRAAALSLKGSNLTGP